MLRASIERRSARCFGTDYGDQYSAYLYPDGFEN